MDFEPKSKIWFLHTGIDAQNKVVCETRDELLACLTRDGNVQGTTESNSFQRAQGSFTIRVDHSDVPYYGLLQSDTVLYINETVAGAFYIVGNIISIEWKNPDCSFVRFQIDAFMTYQIMIDWNKTVAYVEREHVKEDWNGDTPLFTNIGPMEDFNVTPDTPIFHWEKTFTPDKVLIHSPYDSSGKPVFDGSVVGNLFSSLQSPILTADAANEYFETIAEEKEASINNIVGVYGIPNEFATPTQSNAEYTFTEKLDTIEKSNQSTFEIKYRNAKCWSAPFAKVRLLSSDGSFIDFNPQWFGNESTGYQFRLKAVGCGKQFAGVMACFDNENGTFKWENWSDFTVMLSELPKCPWTADGFREWTALNNDAVLGRQISTIVHGIAGLASAVGNAINAVSKEEPGGVVNSISGAATSIVDMGSKMASIQAQINAAQASGATVEGTGSYGSLFDVGQNAWGFKVVYYVVQNYIMRSIDCFFDRFGYKVNTLKQIGIKNRPYWTFVKTAECHVAVTTGIPVVFQNQINAMFNAGVTLWNPDKYKTGHKIGDFSVAEDNRGIGGGS